MKYQPLFKRISFALFIYIKNHQPIFEYLWDLEKSKKNHKIDDSYKKKVIDITS